MSEIDLVEEAAPSTPASGFSRLFANAYGRYSQKNDAGVVLSLVSPYAVNVMDYGAVGDGVADDRAACQAAIDALPPASGMVAGVVNFPAGVYNLGTPGLTIGKGVRLIGAGEHSTLLYGAANTGYALVTTNTGAGGGQEISYMQLQSGGATNSCIRVKGVNGVNIHHNRFFGPGTEFISLDHNNVAGAYTHRIDNNELEGTGTVGVVGIRFTNTQGSPTSGITSTVVSNNTFIGCDTPILYVNFAGGSHGGNTFKGNLMQARSAGVGTGITWTANTFSDMVIGNYFGNFASAMTLTAGSGVGTGLGHMVLGNNNDTNTSFITNGNAAGDGVMLITSSTAALPPGTTTTAPLTMVSGTNLTAAAAGAREFDGKAFYQTAAASTRMVDAGIIFTSTNADFTGTNVTTAQPVFNTTEDVLTVPALTSFELDAVYHIHTTGTTSHTFGILFGGTATLTSIDYLAEATNAATEVLGASQILWCTAATVQVLTAATATATHHTVRIRGIVRINAAGTFIPQYQWGTNAPGVAGVTLRNSYFRLTPLGSNTIKAVGNWA